MYLTRSALVKIFLTGLVVGGGMFFFIAAVLELRPTLFGSNSEAVLFFGSLAAGGFIFLFLVVAIIALYLLSRIDQIRNDLVINDTKKSIINSSID